MNDPTPTSHAPRQAGGRAAAACRGLLLLAAAVAIYWRVLQPGVLPYGHDTFAHDYPIHLWAWNQVTETGRLPLWISPLQNGLPTLGSFAWCPLYPTDWLMAFSVPGGFRLQWPLALLIAGLGMAAWGRAAGLDVAGRWTAAIAFALSGHLVTLISPGHLQKLQAIAWLPWALAVVEWGVGCARQGRAGVVFRRGGLGGLGCGAAVGIQFLASHTQIAYLTLLLAVARAAWLAAESVLFGSGMRGVARRRAAVAALGGFVAFTTTIVVSAGIVGGAQLLTGLETARLSNRAGGVAYEEAVLTSYPPLETLEYVFPRALGDSVRGGWNSYAGEWGERLVTDYAGAGAVLLALIGLGVGARRRGGLRLFLALVFAVTLLLACGRYLPVYRMAYHYLPGFNRFRSPGTQMVLAAFALAALAGVGMTALREAFTGTAAGRARWTLGLGTVAVLFPWVGLGLAGLASGAEARAGATVAAEVTRLHHHKAILLSSAGGSCFWMGIFAGALLAALAVESRWWKREAAMRNGAAGTPAPPPPWHPARWALVVPVAVLAVDLIVRLQPFISPEDMRPYYAYLYQSPDDVAVARDPRLPRRVLARGNELTLRPIVRNIGAPMGYHPVTYRWMQETMEGLGLDSPGLRAAWAVSYVRAPGAEPPDGATSWSLVLEWPSRESPAWTLWRDDRPPPFARFPETLTVGDTGEGLRRAIADHGLDPSRPAVVPEEVAGEMENGKWKMEEGSAGEGEIENGEWKIEKGSAATSAGAGTDAEGKTGTATPEGKSWATVIREGPGEWVLRVGTPGPRWVVLSTPPAPGWRAFVGEANPKALPLWRADGASTLIPWPGGEDFLFLEYNPWSARFGIFLTLFSVAALAAAVGWFCLGRRVKTQALEPVKE